MTETLKKPQLDEISERVTTGQRLSFEDGLALFHSNDLLLVGDLANLVRKRKNGRKTYFVVNRHINYSNISIWRNNGCY